MHRRDLNLLADWVAAQRDPSLATSLADMLEEAYSNFNRERWDVYVAKQRKRTTQGASS